MQQVLRFGNIYIQRKKLDWHLREYEQLAKTEERRGAESGERLRLYERGTLEQVREADGGEWKRKTEKIESVRGRGAEMEAERGRSQFARKSSRGRRSEIFARSQHKA